MLGILGKDYYYSARVYKQKALVKQIEEDIKTMVYTLLRSDKRKLETHECKENEGYDEYPYCKSNDKKYCPSKNKRWRGYIKEYDKDENMWMNPYVFHADTELGIYLDVLNFYLVNKSVYPAVL